MEPYRIGLISDTHGQPLHPGIHAAFAGVSAILHAGDVGADDILVELATIAPVHAVAGNCDYPSPVMPPQRIVALPPGKAAIAHGHLFPENIEARARALAAAFGPLGAALVVTGHSHRQLQRRIDGVLVVNPGAACRQRLAGEDRSVAVATWHADGGIEVAFVALDS